MNHHDGIHDYGKKEKEEEKAYANEKDIEQAKANNNEKQKEK